MSHGQQLLKEVMVKNDFAFERLCPKEQDEVCQPVEVTDVMVVIKSLKINRAPGLDNGTTTV